MCCANSSLLGKRGEGGFRKTQEVGETDFGFALCCQVEANTPSKANEQFPCESVHLKAFWLGLLLIASANAFWRLPCTKPVLNARVDPIVNPGKASGHAHTIMAIGFGTTFADLRNSECTTCRVRDDKSAYWIPELYYQYKNGSFQAVAHGGMLVYYLQRSAANETLQAFPDGLRLLAGNPFLRSYTGTPESQAISWNWSVSSPNLHDC
ncbi:hypothetical protein F5148DRAFT_236708 [Russula earlei]|uniref:Uncharacterized protein n=1 Tax=Russula earlei TaxID=71964 RepID=A0ACC0U517_9AGAM|nr:hypothetical protein F5148DRAFT_236708 [Russula earlei]